jgi:hypothetical protein
MLHFIITNLYKAAGGHGNLWHSFILTLLLHFIQTIGINNDFHMQTTGVHVRL